MSGRDLAHLAAALDVPPELIGGTADGVPAHWNAVVRGAAEVGPGNWGMTGTLDRRSSPCSATELDG